MALEKFPDREQMVRFLYAELPEDEAEAIEEQFFTDQKVFYELTNLEHELVDHYVHGLLKRDDLARFERSLAKSPTRREQIKNARALQRRIREQNRLVPGFESSTRSRWSYLNGLFRTPMLQFGMVLLMLGLGSASVWLYLDRQRLRRELAQLNEQSQQELARQKRVDAELNDRQARLEQQKRELESKQLPLSPRSNESPREYEAKIERIDTMGGSLPEIVRRAKRSVTVELPLEVAISFESYEIKVKSGPAASRTTKVISKGGKKYLVVTLPAKSMDFEVMGIINGRSPKQIAEYKMEISRR